MLNSIIKSTHTASEIECMQMQISSLLQVLNNVRVAVLRCDLVTVCGN